MAARPFHCDQHGPAPFATDTDALQHAEHRQYNRAPYADGRVAGDEGDQECRNAHQQQGRDQGCFPTYAISVVAKDRRADRPSDETDEIGAERCQRSNQRCFIGKEELRKHQPSSGSVDKEIVPFNGGTDRRGYDRLAELCAVRGI